MTNLIVMDDGKMRPTGKIKKSAFLKRMMPELPALYGVAQSDPTAKAYVDLMLSDAFVDLNDQNTIDGLKYFSSKGIYTDDRVSQIVGAEQLESEIYQA